MTLVSIIGDFHSSVLPIFYEFSSSIKRHVIVYDTFKNDRIWAKKILEGTKSFIQKHSLNIETYPYVIEEDSMQSIEALLNTLFSLEPDYQKLHINATDGLSSTALVLSHKLLDKGVQFLTYDRFDNTCNVIHKESMQTYKLQKSIPIEEHFLLKQTHIFGIQNLALADELEGALVEFFEIFQGNKAHYLSKYPHAHLYIQDTQLGFLYELYIYNLLKRLNHDDIKLGVKVKDTYDEIEIQNEFDILIMKNNHLHMIECKFQTSIETTGLIYKVDSLKSVLDEDSKIVILSNQSVYNPSSLMPNMHEPYNRAMTKRIYLRGSPLKNVKLFIRDIDEIFELSTPNLDLLIANRIKPSNNAYENENEKYMYQTIQSYISHTFGVDIDINDPHAISLLLCFKSHYAHNKTVQNAMKNASTLKLIKLINKMHISTKTKVELEDVWQHFKKM